MRFGARIVRSRLPSASYETLRYFERGKWRFLANDKADPDPDTLTAKKRWLEDRLNGKKEQLLEKQLIVEEVTHLSEKLRSQAIEGRQGTLKLSQKVLQ